MNEKEKALLHMCMGMIGSNGVYNHYGKDTGSNNAAAMAISISDNTGAVTRNYWGESTSAGDPKQQYGYASDDDSVAEPSSVDQYHWPRNTDGMGVSWEELWESWKNKQADVDDDLDAEAARAAEAAELAKARELQRRLVEQLIKDTPLVTPISKPQPVNIAPTEVAPIEDELRPLRFLPLVIPK